VLFRSNKDRLVHISSLVRALSVTVVVACANTAFAEPPGDPKSVKKDESGKYFDAKGDPTFNIAPDGTIDWFTYSGFRRYHSECHVCHGPEGDGSSFAPALKNSVNTFNYAEFYGIVVGGKQTLGGGVDKVMPALGDNKNVMCYIDDIYVYLRARGNGLPHGRPAKKEAKTEQATEAEKACLGEAG
jgi:methanol metabolism-related c-type cytochrome